ncbi:MAG TPA: hypothetical protein VGS80_23630 [Ktedonobacterales bacterium]|jgi:hypothetical protein|nr:hypothetical protein [Ktedonobacterales bacterium]
MTGPGGTTTKRDQRRDSRRAQFQQRQLERQRERQRRLRQQRMTRAGIIGAGVLVVALIAFLVIHATAGSSSGPVIVHGTGTYTSPATGEVRNDMTCFGQEQLVYHIHAYLYIYVNGQPQVVPEQTGIPSGANCLYALHVHTSEANIIHIEAPSPATYTLGAFFDIWGQQLSKTQVMTYKADASHPLTFYVFDANGKKTKITGNPLDIPFSNHETIVILYNSPNVTPQPFTGWAQYGL